MEWYEIVSIILALAVAVSGYIVQTIKLKQLSKKLENKIDKNP